MIASARKAFTLIELLVVVAIIGILSSIGVVVYSKYSLNAKIAATKNQHQTIKDFIEASYGKCSLDRRGGLILKTSTSGCSNCNVLGTILSLGTIKRACHSASNVAYFFAYHFNYSGLKNTYGNFGATGIQIGGDIKDQCCLAQGSNPVKGGTYIWGDNNLGRIMIKSNIGDTNGLNNYLISYVDWPGSGF